MTTYVYRNGKVVQKRGRSAVAGSIYVIRDEMEPTRHMATGEYMTSKSKFRQATRAAGCIEVGTETAALLKPRRATMPTRDERRAAIRHTVRQMLHQQRN